MPRKPKQPVEALTRYFTERRVNGYGVAYWVVIDSEDSEAIPGRMPDEIAADNVARLLNSGGERKSCSAL